MPQRSTLPSFSVDRSSPIPMYFQVAQHLEAAITSGTIPPGTLLDNEVALAEEMGLSRPTVRRAMQHLVDKGLVVRRRGIGTRVVQPTVRRRLELSSLYEDLAGTGQEPTTRVLGLSEIEADEHLGGKLGVEVGAPVVEIERLRSAKDQPIARLTNYLPRHVVRFGAEELEERGLYQLLRGQGVTLHSAVQDVGARTATPAEAKLLAEPRGAALLTMERVTFDDLGSVVEYGTHLYAASRYSFEINLLVP